MSDNRQLISFRRCHLCGHLNEEDHGQTIVKCRHCHKSLAPFYYFDDRGSEAVAENLPRSEYPSHRYRPITGLTAYW